MSANDSARTVAAGYSAAAIAAVTGSFSIPTICATSGAKPRNTPAPQPGSTTSPPVNPRSRAACHIADAMDTSV